jgi:hypothetical protein
LAKYAEGFLARVSVITEPGMPREAAYMLDGQKRNAGCTWPAYFHGSSVDGLCGQVEKPREKEKTAQVPIVKTIVFLAFSPLIAHIAPVTPSTAP